MDVEGLYEANRAAWNVTAAKYEAELTHDVAVLGAGGTTLHERELPVLRRLAPACRRAIHLQCSHGSDALSLWKLGAREVVGVDLSEAMLDIARRKAALLGAPAAWVHSNVLRTPRDLDGTADVVYTGKGAIPWVMHIEAWAAVVARLLCPGGRFYVFEGHPIDWVWSTQAPEFRLHDDGGDYFSETPRPNRTFPASAVERFTAPGAPAPVAMERQWTLAAIINALLHAGLVLEQLDEFPEQYWPQFPAIPPDVARRLPHTFALLMRKS